MSKHPTPWYLEGMGYLLDANDDILARLDTDDPETRAVLLHAGDMFAALQEFENSTPGGDDGEAAEEKLCNLTDKIEAEIAKARRS